jgi:hypothetical protein
MSRQPVRRSYLTNLVCVTGRKDFEVKGEGLYSNELSIELPYVVVLSRYLTRRCTEKKGIKDELLSPAGVGSAHPALVPGASRLNHT